MKKRILIIEDDESVRVALLRLLNGIFTATSAYSGEQALDLLNAGAKFDLILSDNDLHESGGKIKGVEFFQKVKEDNLSAGAKLVLMSGGGISADEVKQAEEGLGITFLPKPFHPVLQTINQLLGDGIEEPVGQSER